MKEELKILIADDEPPARRKISSFLSKEEIPLKVIEAENGIDTLEKIITYKPDLVFLDIQMPGLNGFEVIREIGIEKMPQIIFVTAFDQYALDAFEVNAIDYLLKPFDIERFKRSFRKALEFYEVKDLQKDKTKNLLRVFTPTYSLKLVVSQGGKYIFVPVEDIIFISSEEKYVKLHTLRGKYLLRNTMSKMELVLDPQKFTRVHRGFIVNLSCIKEIHPASHGDYKIHLSNGDVINMSRRYRNRINF